MPLRYLKITFTFSLALWALITLLGNFAALEGSYRAVERVVSMAGLPPPMVRGYATSAPIVIWLGVALIIVGKGLAAGGLFVGGTQMWAARSADSERFNRAKSWALFGGWINVLWLFVGFALVGEIIFYMFMSERGGAEAQTALRYALYYGVTMLFIGQAD